MCSFPGQEIKWWEGNIQSCLVGLDAVKYNNLMRYINSFCLLFFCCWFFYINKNPGLPVLSSTRRLEYVCIWKDRGPLVSWVMGWARVTATLWLHSVPLLSLQRCRQLWPSLLRERHCSSCFLMQLSSETKPHMSSRDTVPESIQFKGFCASALGGMLAPGTTGCACKFLFR